MAVEERKEMMKKPLILLLICLTTLFTYQAIGQIHESIADHSDSEKVVIAHDSVSSLESTAEPVAESAASANEDEDFASILLSLILILLAAKIGGDLVERIKQPAVLGELIFGVILGNLYLLGFHGFEQIKHHISIEILAEIGVIILLFEVGLESNLREMMSVGLQQWQIKGLK